jgi:hypothetical protein
MVDTDSTEGWMIAVELATHIPKTSAGNNSQVYATGIGFDDGGPIAAPVGGERGVAHCISTRVVSRDGGGEFQTRNTLQLLGFDNAEKS